MIEPILIGLGAAFIASPIGEFLGWPLPFTVMFSVGLVIIGTIVIL